MVFDLSGFLFFWVFIEGFIFQDKTIYYINVYFEICSFILEQLFRT